MATVSDTVSEMTVASATRSSRAQRAAQRAAERQQRCTQVNALITEIASRGRRFFDHARHGGQISCFEIDAGGRLWFVDGYSKQRIYVAYRGRWRGFTEGGTLRSLIEQLRDYIRTGAPVWSYAFGPWPEWVCGGDLWGYGAEPMQAVRDAVVRLGIPLYTDGERRVA